MDSLKDYINNNRDALDGFEPDSGHFERFEGRLKEKKKRRFITSFAYIAASILLLIGIGFLLYPGHEPLEASKTALKPVGLSDVSADYMEVEMYLQLTVENKEKEMDKLNCPGFNKNHQSIKKELADLDAIYQALQMELAMNNGDERIIRAIIDYYRSKIELLNKVITQVQKNC